MWRVDEEQHPTEIAVGCCWSQTANGLSALEVWLAKLRQNYLNRI